MTFKRNYKALENLGRVIADLRTSASLGVNVGWIDGTSQDVLERVWSMELASQTRAPEYEGWAVARRTKQKLKDAWGNEFIAMWLNGVRGAALWESIGKNAQLVMVETLLGTHTPQLTPTTIEMKFKKWQDPIEGKKYSRGIGVYGPAKIFVETGESLESINYEIVPMSQVKSSV